MIDPSALDRISQRRATTRAHSLTFTPGSRPSSWQDVPDATTEDPTHAHRQPMYTDRAV
jgi:hypothetical protein